MDIKLFRADQGGNPDLIRASQRARFASVELVDEIIALDTEWRKVRGDTDTCNMRLNAVSKQFKARKAAGEGTDDLTKEVENIKAEREALSKREEELAATLRRKIPLVGNLVHASVPVSDNEDNNAVVRTYGEPNHAGGLRHHHELLHMIDGYDSERGVKVAGNRAYFLKGAGVLLNQALIAYATAFLSARGYTALQTPFFMKREVMAETAQLSEFDEALYKVGGDGEDDKYLIATSEQPISAFHRGEFLDPKTLPLRYAGVSTCFRKEAGSSNKDTWGIFRVHQFEKIEQFCLTSPEDSWAEHDRMLALSEEFFQSLGIPYRVVAIVSGALNNAAAKKYDLEGWFPGSQSFRELVSCSNCTDFQSRQLEVRFGFPKQGDREKKYVHMLNSTLCATGRAICAILENYQRDDKYIEVPAVLRPFLGGRERLDFVLPPPKLTASAAASKTPSAAAPPAAAPAAAAATASTASTASTADASAKQ